MAELCGRPASALSKSERESPEALAVTGDAWRDFCQTRNRLYFLNYVFLIEDSWLDPFPI
jgi:hypothetical protein